uniref:hypothetical protein n=1 Tax=Prevotella sp. TaxID=59823 RepID=UPI003FEE55EB
MRARIQGGTTSTTRKAATSHEDTSHQGGTSTTGTREAPPGRHHQGATSHQNRNDPIYNKVCNYIYLQINVNKSYIFV